MLAEFVCELIDRPLEASSGGLDSDNGAGHAPVAPIAQGFGHLAGRVAEPSPHQVCRHGSARVVDASARLPGTEVAAKVFRHRGDDPRAQVSAEMFYRWQMTDVLAVTPNLQILLEPSNDPTRDTITLLGVRARAAF